MGIQPGIGMHLERLRPCQRIGQGGREKFKMFQENVLIQDKPATALWTLPGDGRGVSRKEILRVLERAAGDNSFTAQLTYRGNEALQGYGLTWQENAALLSGDIRWIEMHLGKKLDGRLRTWLDCRLQQEIW
jgi:hypothetical protein